MAEAYRFHKLPFFFFVFSLFQLFLIREETDVKPKSLKVKHADITSDVILEFLKQKRREREER
jgi:hypothetical protein